MEPIAVLTAEWTSLRTEIISRESTAIRTWVTGITALLIIIGLWASPQAGLGTVSMLLLVCVGTILIGGTSFLLMRDAEKAARRCREIEQDISVRAGERLLEWETYWGCAVTGYLTFGADPLPRPPSKSSKT